MHTVFDETLYGITKTGATYVWRIHVEEVPTDRASEPHGRIVITRGLLDGKHHTNSELIVSGKNLGKVNATTPVTQAIFNAESKRNKKLDSGYDYTIEGLSLIHISEPTRPY